MKLPLLDHDEFELLEISSLPADRNEATNQIINCDSRVALKLLAPDSVDCIVTSPPYFNQRDYNHESQVGGEQDIDSYISTLVDVFSDAYRVLKTTGTFWLNLGDKYVDGQLGGIPWRVALALKDSGWIMRSDIIWHKPNAMPSSVMNRPTTDHEYMFMFVKSKNYYYDADAIREPHVTFSDESQMRGGRNHFGVRGGTPEVGKNGGNANLHTGRWDQAFHPKGRNKRTVWKVSLSKFREAHFAVFPEALIEPCIKAGCPKGGVVLDPFFGAGTTGLVALKNSRKFIGIDLNKEYCQIAVNRIFG
jgi:DNA modification methylase